jgi:hypothetical protein
LELALRPIALGQTRLILLRGDAGLGTADTVTLLNERGYLFVLKGRDPRAAHRLADLVAPGDWQCADSHLQAAEVVGQKLTGCPYALRLVLCQRTDAKEHVSHYFLVSNLPVETYSTVESVKFYNGRQTIEAFKSDRGCAVPAPSANREHHRQLCRDPNGYVGSRLSELVGACVLCRHTLSRDRDS